MFFTLKRWIYKRLISRAKLKKWFQLEDIRSKTKEKAENGENIADLLCSYLSSAICAGRWDKLKWDRVQAEYIWSIKLHTPLKDHKIFSNSSREKSNTLSDNSWLMWANMLAESYGWRLDEIAELDIDDAIGLIQEILYSEQLQREWEWGLSEKSVSYDTRTKKAKFHPLERPDWMKIPKKIIEPEKHRIFKDHLPPGVVVRWNDSNVKH